MTGNAIASFLLTLWLGISTSVSSGGSGVRSGIAARCVHWKAEARFEGLGFSHYVHLHNRCEVFMRCEVKTSVNKTPRTIDLDPDEKRTVKTFAVSPASEFETYVTCTRGTPAQSGAGEQRSISKLR